MGPQQRQCRSPWKSEFNSSGQGASSSWELRVPKILAGKRYSCAYLSSSARLPGKVCWMLLWDRLGQAAHADKATSFYTEPQQLRGGKVPRWQTETLPFGHGEQLILRAGPGHGSTSSNASARGEPPPLTPNCMNITTFLAGVSHEQSADTIRDQWLFQQRSKNNLFNASEKPCCRLWTRRKVQKVSPILKFSINLGEWKKKTKPKTIFCFK